MEDVQLNNLWICYQAAKGNSNKNDKEVFKEVIKNFLISEKEPVAEVPCSDGLEAIAFLLTLVPEWALNMEQGLDPTYYGTGSYEGDKKVHDRVMEIKGLLEKESL